MRVMFARLQYGGMVHGDVCEWWASTILEARCDERFKRVVRLVVDVCPTDAARNMIVDLARQSEVDYVVMVDYDMSPAQGWWKAVADFIAERQIDMPLVIAAPYCDGDEQIIAFDRSQDSQYFGKLVRAADGHTRTGFGLVAGAGTGLSLWSIAAFNAVETPYFQYNYNQDHTTALNSEDIYGTVKMTNANIPIYCTWDHWAGHWKPKQIGKPQVGKPPAVNSITV